MNARHLRWLLVVAAAALAQSRDACAVSPATNSFATTLSTSRQFTAYADNPLLASALCVYAERVKHEWLRRMDVPDNWRDPILLVVHTRETAQTNTLAISMETIQTDVHLKYQIRCLVPPPLDEAKLLVTVVGALCSEWANREQSISRGHLYTAPAMPLWLVEGLAASIQGRFEFLLATARRSVAAGRPQSAADVMGVRVLPTDAADRQLFQANAWLFTESILALPDGSRKLRSFLSELGARKAVGNAFWTVYHRDFPQSAALDEWWSREEARRISVTLAQDLSATETARRLDAILVTKLGPTNGRKGDPDETVTSLENLWKYSEEPWLMDVLRLKSDDLGTLRGLAHPLYRPVVDKYLEAVKWLIWGSAAHFRRAAGEAKDMQVVVDRQAHAIAAYMDQAEHVYAPEELSQVFDGYFQTFDQAHKLEGERRSPISDYLDKFDH